MNTTAHAQALAQFLSIDVSEVSEMGYDHYGLPLFSADGADYAVGTDSEADEAATESIRGSLWAFNASFILSECDLPSELEDGIRALQESKCEDCNDAIEALVEKCCVGAGSKQGVESFAEDAISADGRGHFLSGYDGKESEQEVEGVTYFIYRTN